MRSSAVRRSTSSRSTFAQSTRPPKSTRDTAAASRGSTVRRRMARATNRCASGSPAKCASTASAASSLSMRAWTRSSSAAWSRQSGSSHAARAASYCVTRSLHGLARARRFFQRTMRSASGRLAASLHVASGRRTRNDRRRDRRDWQPTLGPACRLRPASLPPRGRACGASRLPSSARAAVAVAVGAAGGLPSAESPPAHVRCLEGGGRRRHAVVRHVHRGGRTRGGRGSHLRRDHRRLFALGARPAALLAVLHRSSGRARGDRTRP